MDTEYQFVWNKNAVELSPQYVHWSVNTLVDGATF
jgi:hypothetical protein